MKDKKLVHSAFGILHSALISLALAGCEGGYGSKQGDPFMGVHAPPMPVSPTGGGAAATQAAANTPPPLPASVAVPSQAALAGGTTPKPEDPRTLRIDTPPVVPVSSSGGAVRGVAPSPVQVDGPIPIPESTSKSSPAPIASAGMRPTGGVVVPPPPGAAMTFEQVQQQLKQRGVVWQRLEVDQGKWKFQCSLPIPGSKGMNRMYMTDAPLPSNPLAAMRAVLDKIEKEQR